jgi:hypothetical protein
MVMTKNLEEVTIEVSTPKKKRDYDAEGIRVSEGYFIFMPSEKVKIHKNGEVHISR